MLSYSGILKVDQICFLADIYSQAFSIQYKHIEENNNEYLYTT